MRSGLIGAFAGAALVAAITFFLFLRPLGDAQGDASARIGKLEQAVGALAKAKPRYAYITLRRSESARCLADIDVPHMGGYKGEVVRWNVVDDADNPCRPDGPWAVSLVFEGTAYPFPQRETRIGRIGRSIPIKDDIGYGIYTYKVWMRGHNGADYELIDPDLEVEPPPF